jgi:ABC-type transporter lipoprotein component MlaA/pimeloyl-ACP methyl ester carboxylesterase
MIFAPKRVFYLMLLMCCGVPASPAQLTAISNAPSEVIVLPASVPDPIEPFNRAMWAFNRELMSVAIRPSSKVYRFVVRKPIRTGISNLGRNINYPGRLINHLLQARWMGARDETQRFFCNTVLGGAGIFDVATRWDIPKSDADFGQTFGEWGWRPRCYVMLPLFGPSNERDTLGLVADNAANPLSYVTPYSVTTENPLTFISPYMYFSYTVTYNNLSDTVDDYVRFTETEADPYSMLQYAWTFVRKNRTPDFNLKEEPDQSSLETLQSVLVSFKDPKFPERGQTWSAPIAATGRRLNFTHWIQPKKAPVVYIVPGLGSHRLANNVLSLAELVYQNGFSVVSVSSPYNHEFMEQASTAAMPAYTPVDAHDLHVALNAIDRQLNKQFPKRLGTRALMGYSMGGFQSLFVAATATNQPSLIKFDRFVAIDTPVRLTYGIARLDEFYNAPLAWPREERTANIENTLLKVAASRQNPQTSQATNSFGAVESKFLVGLAFRLVLRDIIFSSQRRNDQGILQKPLKGVRREQVYQEILQYSYADYFQKFAVPYYQARGIDLAAPEALERAGDLRSHAGNLQTNSDVRIIVNENDFLLTREELDWLRTTFGPERLTVFKRGGHLGNLDQPEVQESILRALSGL